MENENQTNNQMTRNEQLSAWAMLLAKLDNPDKKLDDLIQEMEEIRETLQNQD